MSFKFRKLLFIQVCSIVLVTSSIYATSGNKNTTNTTQTDPRFSKIGLSQLIKNYHDLKEKIKNSEFRLTTNELDQLRQFEEKLTKFTEFLKQNMPKNNTTFSISELEEQNKQLNSTLDNSIQNYEKDKGRYANYSKIMSAAEIASPIIGGLVEAYVLPGISSAKQVGSTSSRRSSDSKSTSLPITGAGITTIATVFICEKIKGNNSTNLKESEKFIESTRKQIENNITAKNQFLNLLKEFDLVEKSTNSKINEVLINKKQQQKQREQQEEADKKRELESQIMSTKPSSPVLTTPSTISQVLTKPQEKPSQVSKPSPIKSTKENFFIKSLSEDFNEVC